ncbi:MAG: hypothetical protein CMD02_05620 [Flavobacteriales bacterium]|nr:hypothetical protein [Flavobacteriales bacterium]|tara:strand:+ start:10050 stop:10688 length:639 start_codon:yes stop_codon:yes gene_type:complete
MRYNFLVIEGNIGSGKTNLAKKIAEDFNGKLILEAFADNPFLPKFYKESERNALPLELFFMAERFQQLNEKKNTSDLFSKLIVADYSFFKSKLFAQNNLKEDELNLFNRLYDIMFYNVKKPELLIYIHSDVERLQKNIKKRGRKFELEIKDEYLKSIENKYLDYLKKQRDFPVLIIDVSSIDFVNNKSSYKKILDEINFISNNEQIRSVTLD